MMTRATQLQQVPFGCAILNFSGFGNWSSVFFSSLFEESDLEINFGFKYLLYIQLTDTFFQFIMHYN